MTPRHRPARRLSYANVMATAAFALALGGTAYAATLPAHSVGTVQLKNGAVTTPKLRTSAVTTPKLASGAVTGAKLAPDAVTGAAVADHSLSAVDLAAGTLPGTTRHVSASNEPASTAAGTSATVLTLANLAPGNYHLTGTVNMLPLGTGQVTCNLAGNGVHSAGLVRSTTHASEFAEVALDGVVTVPATEDISISCLAFDFPWTVEARWLSATTIGPISTP